MDFGSLLVEQHLPDACLKNLRKLTGPWPCKLKRTAFRLHVAQVVFALAQTLRIQLVLCVGSYSQWVLGKTQLFQAAFKHAMSFSFVCWGKGEAWRKVGGAHL